MDWKLELIPIPVSNVDRAKAFYERVGFNADQDHTLSDNFSWRSGAEQGHGGGDVLRFVQLTPPGSACSIAIGVGITEATPGSARGMQLVVQDIEAARQELLGRGVEVSEVHEFPWGKFVFFADLDGNTWAVQQLPMR
jgi:catechol 2,3-dioxygenase-like lactoylglutathione lyase family enzyme